MAHSGVLIITRSRRPASPLARTPGAPRRRETARRGAVRVPSKERQLVRGRVGGEAMPGVGFVDLVPYEAQRGGVAHRPRRPHLPRPHRFERARHPRVREYSRVVKPTLPAESTSHQARSPAHVPPSLPSSSPPPGEGPGVPGTSVASMRGVKSVGSATPPSGRSSPAVRRTRYVARTCRASTPGNSPRRAWEIPSIHATPRHGRRARRCVSVSAGMGERQPTSWQPRSSRGRAEGTHRGAQGRQDPTWRAR